MWMLSDSEVEILMPDFPSFYTDSQRFRRTLAMKQRDSKENNGAVPDGRFPVIIELIRDDVITLVSSADGIGIVVAPLDSVPESLRMEKQPLYVTFDDDTIVEVENARDAAMPDTGLLSEPAASELRSRSS